MGVTQTSYGPAQRSTLANWQFRKFHLALDRGGRNTGTFMTGEATLIAAGPPRLQDLQGKNIADSVVPIAVAENVAVNQNKMLQQIFEIGSRRSYFVSGHVTGSINISRPMFNGPSLLRVLTGANLDQQDLDEGGGADPGLLPVGGTGAGAFPNEDEPEFYINMHAEIFDRPLGILFRMIDQRNRPYGSMYAEDCMIQAHAFNIASQAMTIAENVSMMFDRITPVSVNALPTVSAT